MTTPLLMFGSPGLNRSAQSAVVSQPAFGRKFSLSGKRDKAKPAEVDPFETGKPKEGRGKKALKGTALGLLFAYGAFNWGMILPACPWTSPGAVTSKVGWDDNVTVFASGSQSDVTFTVSDNPLLGTLPFVAPDRTGTYYSQALIDQLEKPGVKSLAEAQARLVSKGYDSFLGFNPKALTTPNRDVGWNKDDKETRRYVLIITGEEFTKAGPNMADALKRNFGLEDNNIKLAPNASSRDVIDGMIWLVEQLKADPDVEVMIYYSGHGANDKMPFSFMADGLEGDAEGYIKLEGPEVRYDLKNKEGKIWKTLDDPRNEEGMKQWVETLFPGVKTLMVFDTCHSGSWIA